MKFNYGNGTIWNGDCLDLMHYIPSGSVDMILCDLPYGTTACKWDTIIPFAPLWEQYWRIAKPNAAVVLTASQPFTTALISSQIDQFKYCWIWQKNNITGFMQAKTRPLKSFEDVCVFGKFRNAAQYFDGIYNPQGNLRSVGQKEYSNIRAENHITGNRKAAVSTDSKTGYPKDVLQFDGERGLHPTQKPVALFEYLIKTYTNPGETVLDNCSGSGTTAIAAQRTGRRFICIEKDLNYYLGSCGRLSQEVKL